MVSYTLSQDFVLDHYDFYAQVPHLTKPIGETYKGHETWLNTIFFPNLKYGTRGYSFAIDYDAETLINTGILGTKPAPRLAGCSLLKNTSTEKKLCCLFVDPSYRGQGIASHLIKDSFEILQTDKPLMTVAENNLAMLTPLIKKFNFELTSVKESIYKPGVKEYFYNEGLAR